MSARVVPWSQEKGILQSSTPFGDLKRAELILKQAFYRYTQQEVMLIIGIHQDVSHLANPFETLAVHVCDKALKTTNRGQCRAGYVGICTSGFAAESTKLLDDTISQRFSGKITGFKRRSLRRLNSAEIIPFCVNLQPIPQVYGHILSITAGILWENRFPAHYNGIVTALLCSPQAITLAKLAITHYSLIDLPRKYLAREAKLLNTDCQKTPRLIDHLGFMYDSPQQVQVGQHVVLWFPRDHNLNGVLATVSGPAITRKRGYTSRHLSLDKIRVPVEYVTDDFGKSPATIKMKYLRCLS